MRNQKTNTFMLLSITLLIVIALSTVSCNSGSAKPPAVDIHTATIIGDIDAVKQHIKAGSDLDAKEASLGSSPLISAAVFGKTEVAKIIGRIYSKMGILSKGNFKEVKL
ncbi:MAG: hypothetical protein HN936_20150, partial [Bacteroidetes bacterium]|nr:hypothetical protein [Bacteroidota bacterium]